MRLNSTTPKTSAAAVKIRLYTMPNVVTVPVPKGSHAENLNRRRHGVELDEHPQARELSSIDSG